VKTLPYHFPLSYQQLTHPATRRGNDSGKSESLLTVLFYLKEKMSYKVKNFDSKNNVLYGQLLNWESFSVIHACMLFNLILINEMLFIHDSGEMENTRLDTGLVFVRLFLIYALLKYKEYTKEIRRRFEGDPKEINN
jgi:uncharacterized membrane protein